MNSLTKDDLEYIFLQRAIPLELDENNQSLAAHLIALVDSNQRRQQKEIDRLRTHLIEQEEAHTQELLELQSELKLKETPQGKSLFLENEIREDIEEELMHLRTEIELLRAQLSEKQLINANLESAMLGFEKDKRMEQELMLTHFQECKSKMESRLTSLVQDLEDQKKLNQELVNELEQLKKNSSTDPIQYTQPSSPNIIFQPEVKDLSGPQHLDIQLLANLLKQYFTIKTEETAVEVLVLLTKILGMSDHDRSDIGLERNGHRWQWKLKSAPEHIIEQGSLADQWIAFLMTESKDG